jgi:transcriptional regulator with XRE-family HTH domain
MTGPDLRAIRTKLGLSVYDFGRALGYQGNDNTVGVQIRRFETDAREIPPYLERLAVMYGRYGVPREYRP